MAPDGRSVVGGGGAESVTTGREKLLTAEVAEEKENAEKNFYCNF